MRKYPSVIDLQDLIKFKFCPFCGDPSIHTYDGDYDGYTGCLNEECEEEIDFMLIAEVKHRYPDSFKKWVDKL